MCMATECWRCMTRSSTTTSRHMNIDPKTAVGIYISSGTWMLGYPDRAVQLCDANDAHAHRRGRPFDLGVALTLGTQVWDYRCEPAQMLARAEEAERLGRAHSLPFISDVLAQIDKGIAWLRAGRLTEGIPQLRGALETWNAHGNEIVMPYWRAALAEGLALSSDVAGGLQLIEESITQIARPGWEERWGLAEILRLKGWMLMLQGDFDRCGAKLSCFARLGTRATGEVLGTTHLDQPRATMAATRQAKRSSQAVGRRIRLVH